MPSDLGSETYPKGKVDLLLPKVNQPTSVPSLSQQLPDVGRCAEDVGVAENEVKGKWRAVLEAAT